jgi:hypothetical protein
MNLKDIEIKPPNISDETMKEMVKFFMKTSIPRIIEHERLKEVNKTGNSGNQSDNKSE